MLRRIRYNVGRRNLKVHNYSDCTFRKKNARSRRYFLTAGTCAGNKRGNKRLPRQRTSIFIHSCRLRRHLPSPSRCSRVLSDYILFFFSFFVFTFKRHSISREYERISTRETSFFKSEMLFLSIIGSFSRCVLFVLF